ncbi:MAG: winged helix-turn-helix domain-containing protein [Paracoccaceae bacterium]
MHLKLRLEFDGGLVMGPGKAALLEAIGREGSIAAAARALGMSYKRAWSLVEEMNDGFSAPLVLAARGGQKGGGAGISVAGTEVLTRFRALEARLLADEQGDLRVLGDMVRQK